MTATGSLDGPWGCTESWARCTSQGQMGCTTATAIPTTAWPHACGTALAMVTGRARPPLTCDGAGFDAHKKDEINFRYIGVTERDYEWLTDQLVQVANRYFVIIKVSMSPLPVGLPPCKRSLPCCYAVVALSSFVF